MSFRDLFSFGSNRAGPKGTGEFVEVLDWWLWDDPTSPGLMTRDAFERAREDALPVDEHRWLRDKLTSSDSHPSKSRHRLDIKTAQQLQRKVSEHLVELQQSNPQALNDIITSDWNRSSTRASMLNVLEAYIDVLTFWDYPYRRETIQDARSLENALLLLTNGQPTYFFRDEDIRGIRGRPSNFSISIIGPHCHEDGNEEENWSFDHKVGSFELRGPGSSNS